MGEKWKQWQILFSWAPKSLQTETAVMKLKDTFSLVGFPSRSDGKEPACNAGDLGSIPGLGRSPGEGMATHSSILAWRIPWTDHGVSKSQTQLFLGRKAMTNLDSIWKKQRHPFANKGPHSQSYGFSISHVQM